MVPLCNVIFGRFERLATRQPLVVQVDCKKTSKACTHTYTHTWSKVMRIDVIESPSTSLTPSCAVPFQMQDVASHDLNPTLPKVYLQRDVCFTAFAVFDQDGDGRITLDELKQFLSEIRTFTYLLSKRFGRTYSSFTGTVSSIAYESCTV